MAQYELCGCAGVRMAHEEQCGMAHEEQAELAQSRTTSDFGRQLPAPEPQDAPGNLVGAPGKYVEGRLLVCVVGRRAALSHERAKDQDLLLDVARVGPFGRSDAVNEALDSKELTTPGQRRILLFLLVQQLLGRRFLVARIQLGAVA